ncbi:hypothetical protein GCM10027053_01210 [Intrasporangium mesophilum]
MTDWVTKQVDLLRTQWPNLSYLDTGHWVLLPGWQLLDGWSVATVDVAFQIRPDRETPPYAFYVNTRELTHNGKTPENWTMSAEVPFPGTWSVFSWGPETWVPTVDPDRGPNMLGFARSFQTRFAEGA